MCSASFFLVEETGQVEEEKEEVAKLKKPSLTVSASHVLKKWGKHPVKTRTQSLRASSPSADHLLFTEVLLVIGRHLFHRISQRNEKSWMFYQHPVENVGQQLDCFTDCFSYLH